MADRRNGPRPAAAPPVMVTLRRLAKATIAAWVAVVAPWQMEAAQAQSPVSIELVLAVDTSLSVDDAEFALQMRGIAWAFRTPEIIALIGQRDGVAVTLFQWSSEADPSFVIPWRLLRGPATVLAFAGQVERMAREPNRRFTAMGRAIDVAIDMIAGNAWVGRELKIDIAADGRSNTGPVPADAWPRANALGIAINGLPILVDTYNLDSYFREKVIAGPGAFVETATDYNDFARAFLRKLRRELTPVVSRNGHVPAGPSLASRQARQ